jgi:RNA polymerase sigma factor (sigma-70 family)
MQEQANAQIEQAFQAYGVRILHLLWQRVHNLELAQDLTQETFVRAWRNLVDNPKEGDTLNFTWFAVIAVRISIDYYRRSRLFTLLPLSQSENGTDDEMQAGEWSMRTLTDEHGENNPEQVVLAREELAEVSALLFPKDRQIFQLLEYGYSSQEVKEMVQTEPRVRIFRARQRLAQKLCLSEAAQSY